MQMSVKSFLPPSRLTPGRHPAFLIHVDEEPTPTDWQMAKKSPTMWRWYVAVWEHPDLIGQREPEIQSALTSATFSPKGKYPASTAYLWAQEMLQRQIPVGEVIDWDALVPYPCSVKVERYADKDYVKIRDLEAWGEGNVYLPGLRALLLQHREVAKRASETARTRAPEPANGQAAASPSPATTWGSAASSTPPVGWGAGGSVAPAASPRQPGEEPDDDIPF